MTIYYVDYVIHDHISGTPDIMISDFSIQFCKRVGKLLPPARELYDPHDPDTLISDFSNQPYHHNN